MQSTIHSTISKRQRWHSSVHPFSCTQSCICTLPWGRALPTQLFSFSYLQIPAGIHRVSLSEHQFPPRKTKFLPYQGCLFFVFNKLQNEISSALIISNVIFSLVSELLMASKQTSGSLKVFCAYLFSQPSAWWFFLFLLFWGFLVCLFLKAVFNLYITLSRSENTFLTNIRNIVLEGFRTRFN